MPSNDSAVLLRRMRILLNAASVAFLIIGITALSVGSILMLFTSTLTFVNVLSMPEFDVPKIIYLVLSGTISIYSYMEVGDIINSINEGRFEGLKDRFIICSVLGIVFGFILPGILVVVALFRYYNVLIRGVVST